MEILWTSRDGMAQVARASSLLRFRLIASDDYVEFLRLRPDSGKTFMFRSKLPVWSSGRYLAKAEFKLICEYLNEWTGRSVTFELDDVEFLEDLEAR